MSVRSFVEVSRGDISNPGHRRHVDASCRQTEKHGRSDETNTRKCKPREKRELENLLERKQGVPKGDKVIKKKKKKEAIVYISPRRELPRIR